MNSSLEKTTPKRQTSKIALASMIFGIISTVPLFTGPLGSIGLILNWKVDIFVFGPIGVAAFVLGIIALIKTRKNGSSKNLAFALIGLICSIPEVMLLSAIPLAYLGAFPD